MNKLKFSILIGACAVMATACEDKLDEEQKGVIQPEQFYQTDADAQNALNGMYDEFSQVVANAKLLGIHNAPFFAYNLCGDDMYAAGEFYGDNDFMSQHNEFRYATDHEDLTHVYRAYYSAIYTANLVINNVAGESDIQKQCIAEARVIRAYCHMQLAIGWFDPPKSTEVLKYDSEGLTNSEDHYDLLRWCAEECLDVMDNLEERNGTADKNGTIKVTKGFAQFVAGKSYMFAGDFAKSKDALKPLVESPNYALVPGERIGETFLRDGDGNEEQILAMNIAENKSVPIWNGMINRSTWMYCNIMNWRTDHFDGLQANTITGWGGLGVREDFAADFIAHDCGIDPKDIGDPKTKEGLVGGDAEISNFDAYDPYAYKKDPKAMERYRRRAWMRNIEEVLYEMSGGGPTDKGHSIKSYLYGQTHFLEYKRQFRVDELYKDEAFPARNTLLARLAEAYLLYAEACARTGDDAEAMKYLKAIQERANSATVGLGSAKDLLTAIKEEKRFEMFCEGCRWPDMVRWSEQDKGDGVDYFERIRNNGKTVPELYDNLMMPNDKATQRFYVIATHPNEGRGEVGFTEPSDAPNKFKYYPIPFVEVNSNPNIVQHDGWK